MKSMTGFGKETLQHDVYHIDVEIKTVNHRFLDMQLRMPKEANPYELGIRQLIKTKLQRGRVEVYVNLQKNSSSNKTVHIHWPLIHQLLQSMETELVDNYAIEQFDPSTSLNQLLNNSDYVEVIEEKTDDTQLEELL